VIYETMPPDRHAIFAGMTEEELKQKLPPQSIQEYIRHGKEATPDDDEARQVGYDADGKRLPPDQLASAAKRLYQRRLRDYATEFDELTRRRVEMDVARAEVQADIARLTTAVASAKELQAFREDELRRLRSDLAGIQKERQAIEQHLAQVKQQLARARQLLAETLKRNSEMVRRLAGEDRTTRAIERGPANSPPAISVALGSAN
jgi:septal ring factor EnvC (AmiA/AmiB activator)